MISVVLHLNLFPSVLFRKPASPSISSSPQRRTPPLGPGHNSRDHDSRSVTTTSSIDSNHNAAPRTNSHDQVCLPDPNYRNLCLSKIHLKEIFVSFFFPFVNLYIPELLLLKLIPSRANEEEKKRNKLSLPSLSYHHPLSSNHRAILFSSQFKLYRKRKEQERKERIYNEKDEHVVLKENIKDVSKAGNVEHKLIWNFD